jgi:hypothetical protein
MALWQSTNRPHATVEYVAKGLKWGIAKVRNNKRALEALGFIEDIKQTGASGRVTGWYVGVKYFHPIDKPEGGESHSVDSEPTNALRANKGSFEKTTRDVSLKTSSVRVSKRAYPQSQEEFSAILEKEGVEEDPDHDGDFFNSMVRAGWKIRGKPILDWVLVYQARLEKTQP